MDINTNYFFKAPCFNNIGKRPDRFDKSNDQLKAKWLNLGLDGTWFDSDPEGAEALLSTRLIYSILGFQNTKSIPESEVRFNNRKNGIEIRMEGQFVLVKEKFLGQFVFSREGGGTIQDTSTGKNWTYLGTDGLVPVDRWTHDEFLPVVNLSSDQLAKLRDHTKTKSLDSCFIQIVTVPRDLCVEQNSLITPFKKNYKKTFPLHAYIRLIDKNGDVYSTGFGSTAEEDKIQSRMGYFSTINGMPTILDYEEFRPHEGRVTTTYAISQDRLQRTLNQIREDRRDTVRFNILNQNCNTLALRYLKTSGVGFAPIKMSVREVIYEIVPDIFQFKEVRKKFNRYTPEPLKTLVKTVYKVFRTVLEYLISIIILNPFLILKGANKSSKLNSGKSKEDVLIAQKSKVHLFSNAFDLEIDFSLRTIEKQLSYSNIDGVTWVHNYNGPNMYIIPDKKQENADRNLLRLFQSVYNEPIS